MSISNLISTNSIIFDLSINKKEELFDEIAALMSKLNVVSNTSKFKKDLYKREKEVSTGIEDNFGIPHAISRTVQTPCLAFFRTSPISDYVGLDDTEIFCTFIIALPEHKSEDHLEILSSLSRKLMNQEFRLQIKNAKTPQEVLSILVNNDRKDV